jgi:hypothetical protein
LEKLCDARDDQDDDLMEEYSGDIQALIDDLSGDIGVDVTDEFLEAADRITQRPVKSYFEQGIEIKR